MTAKLPSQQQFFDEQSVNEATTNHQNAEWLESYLASADLINRAPECESWEIKGSSAQLSYLTHGFFRYFGKFPPPVARRFIQEMHDPAIGPIIDPMVGSGTTLVEALLLKRHAIGFDVNPLAHLISKVKTTPVSYNGLLTVLEDYERFYEGQESGASTQYIPKDPYIDHWFYPQTQAGIARTRQFIDQEVQDADLRDVLCLTLASVIRKLSRASNGLGRMFLDPAIPPLDTREHFMKKARQIADEIRALDYFMPTVKVHIHDAQQPFPISGLTNLVICHPPYFNVYRYSSIYKFEMLWLGYDYPDTKKREVREGFKLGKQEVVHAYVDDMTTVFNNIKHVLIDGGRCVLMIGDTFLRGDRINTTAMLLDRITGPELRFRVERIIIRHPKYTEASYAATQRRTSEDIGVKLPDHLIVLQKGT